ncbi:MAG: DNA polymerase IV [Sphingobacteriales bacterium]|uniref:DNA polymerase IV n=1 Tax=Hydrotalea flava TaxID=714549 RepID=UPI0008378988|nr:DNA polymerase IV [Hydrotalea flava]RTL48114.1 MAG: DNA polymerase IV [Sphingobacteriales bacterium]
MHQPQRYIAHFDLDSFFVSVEVIKNPALQHRPVLVGGSSERGVVAACSYAARKFGIHSAMPMKRALQLCPHAIVLPGSYKDYTRFSNRVTDIIAHAAPAFQKASIDEFYIDLTGMDVFFNPLQWTIDLRQQIMAATGLPISFGLASTKLIAKIATDEAKPNGYLFVQPGKEIDFLAPLPIQKIPGVGKHTLPVLQQMGIHTIQDILQFTPQHLEQKLGKWGQTLHSIATGSYDMPLENSHETKSISTEQTFAANTTERVFLEQKLVQMTEKVAYELRQEGLFTACIAIKIRYADFTTTSKQATIPLTFCDDELIPVAQQLLQQLLKPHQPVRLLGVRLSALSKHGQVPDLFNQINTKANLYKAIDAVKNKYGTFALQKGRSV